MAPRALRKIVSTIPLETIYSVGEGRTVAIGLDGCRDCRNAFAQWLHDGQQPDDRIVVAIAAGSSKPTTTTPTSDAAPSQNRTHRRSKSCDVRHILAPAGASEKAATAVVKNTVVVPGLPLDDFGDWDKKSRAVLLKLAEIGAQEKVRFEAIRLPSASTALSFARSLVDCCHSIDAHLLLLPAHDCSALLPFPALFPRSLSASSAAPSASSASSASASPVPLVSADARARRVASFCSLNAPCPVSMIGRLGVKDGKINGGESTPCSSKSFASEKVASLNCEERESCGSDAHESSSSNGDSSNGDGDFDAEFCSSSSSGSSASNSPSSSDDNSQSHSPQSQFPPKPTVQARSQGKRTSIHGFSLPRPGLGGSSGSKPPQVGQLVRQWVGGKAASRGESVFCTSRGFVFSVCRGKEGVASVG
ncbi:hypothetical protein CLOM_g4631 [Closterium sp. NIES-68]|nr:hypothetical protein CLOM_g4631 [Closterium sp. NIES-68]GJP85756.1 hypothetical protein CLOP_g15855 [Closterium sp. NIES-67]